jgi:hypothetical protein
MVGCVPEYRAPLTELAVASIDIEATSILRDCKVGNSNCVGGQEFGNDLLRLDFLFAHQYC